MKKVALAMMMALFVLLPVKTSAAEETGHIELWFYLQYGLVEGNVEFTVLEADTKTVVGVYELTPDDYIDSPYMIELPEGRYIVCQMSMEGSRSDTYTYEIHGEDGTPSIGVYAGRSSYMEAYIGAPWLGDSFITEEVMKEYDYETYPVEFMLNGCRHIESNILVYVDDEHGTSYELIFKGGKATGGLITKHLPEGKYKITDVFVAGENDTYSFDIRDSFEINAYQEMPPLAYISCETKYGKFYYCLTAETLEKDGSKMIAPDMYVTYVNPAEEQYTVDEVLGFGGGDIVSTKKGTMTPIDGPCDIYVCKAFYIDSFGKAKDITFDRAHIVIPEVNSIADGYVECAIKLVHMGRGQYEVHHEIKLFEKNDMGNYVQVSEGSLAEQESESTSETENETVGGKETEKETVKQPVVEKESNGAADDGTAERKGSSGLVFGLLWAFMGVGTIIYVVIKKKGNGGVKY